MSEKKSQLLLKFETAFLLLPLTLVTAIYAVFCINLYSTATMWKEPLTAHAAPAFTFIGLGILITGLYIVDVFLSRGRLALAGMSTLPFRIILLGAILCIVGLIANILMLINIELPETIVVLYVNYLATPALVPFAHIVIERQISKKYVSDGRT